MAARKKLPSDKTQAMTLFDEAQKKAKVASQLAVRRCRCRCRCRSIVAYDLSTGANRKKDSGSYQSMGLGIDTYLTLINFIRTGMTLAEQTMRASMVRDYTERVVQPDFELALAYLTNEPDVDPVVEIIAERDPFYGLPLQSCTVQKAFMDPAGKTSQPPASGGELPKQLEQDMALDFGKPHGRLALLAAQARTTAVRQSYIHFANAKLLSPPSGTEVSPVQAETTLRLATDAADAMARADGLIAIDVDCDVLPKLTTAQRQLSKAVIEGTGSTDVADGLADALTNLLAILEALDKAKKAGW